MAKLKVIRNKSLISATRDIHVFVDGQKVGSIANGKDQDFDIAAGDHVLICKMAWYSSKDHPFTVADNASETVFIQPSPVSLFMVVPLILILVLRTKLEPLLHHYHPNIIRTKPTDYNHRHLTLVLHSAEIVDLTGFIKHGDT